MVSDRRLKRVTCRGKIGPALHCNSSLPHFITISTCAVWYCLLWTRSLLLPIPVGFNRGLGDVQGLQVQDGQLLDVVLGCKGEVVLVVDMGAVGDTCRSAPPEQETIEGVQ